MQPVKYTFRTCISKKSHCWIVAQSRHFCNQSKGILIIEFVLLHVPFSNKLSFVTSNGTIRSVFEFICYAGVSVRVCSQFEFEIWHPSSMEAKHWLLSPLTGLGLEHYIDNAIISITFNLLKGHFHINIKFILHTNEKSIQYLIAAQGA